MVLRLGKFFARSTIATRVPINGPSTLGSAKMPAVCIPLSGCDAFALDANMFCVCCICCVVRCCSMGQFGCRFVLTRRRTTTKSEAAGKPHSDADADRDRKMLATLRYRERARLHWRLGSSFFFLEKTGIKTMEGSRREKYDDRARTQPTGKTRTMLAMERKKAGSQHPSLRLSRGMNGKRRR